MFCSKHYFEFICFVDSTYLHNLTLEMMMAYAHGDLINVIKRHMLDNKHVMVKFRFQYNNDSVYSKSECQKLLKYIFERYANMRGTYFAKHLKGTTNSNINKVVDSQAIRTRVLNAVA